MIQKIKKTKNQLNLECFSKIYQKKKKKKKLRINDIIYY